MRVQTGQLVSLGYGRYVRSDEVVAVEPVVEGRGPGRRSLVWVRGVPDPLVGSRAEGSVVDDLVTPADEATRMKAQRTVLRDVLATFEGITAGVQRVVAEESGRDISALVEDVRRVLR